MKMLILAVMILLLGFVINVSGQPQVTAKQHKNRPCKQPCNQMDDISPISSVRMSPPSDGEHSEQNSQKATDNPIGWHKFFTWPDGILAIAAILTFGAITWQSFETGRAARAMKKSVRLQEAALRQWVTVTDWESELLKDSLNLKISFQVNNPTDNPLQITAVFMNFVAIRKVEKVESAQWIAPK